jgi:hypothetical protein
MKKLVLITTAAIAILFGCKKKNNNVNGSCSTCNSCVMGVLNYDTINTNPFYYVQILPNYFSATDTFWQNSSMASAGSFIPSPQGIYGIKPVALAINLDSLLPGNSVTSFKFTHAFLSQNSNPDSTFVNIKIDGHPRIETITDSLQYYLTPLGYTVQFYRTPTMVMMGNTPIANINGAYADSVIITSPNAMHKVTIGAALLESELRNVCFSY